MVEPTIKLARSNGPVTNTKLKPWAVSWTKFTKEFESAPVGEKDGTYWVRGRISKPCARKDANVECASVVIIDADKRIDDRTGEIIDGAPPVYIAEELLTKLGYRFLLHTTGSHRGEEYSRYRIVLVPSRPLAVAELGVVSDAIVAEFQHWGLPVAPMNEREGGGTSQAWFFPRVPRDQLHHYECIVGDGELLDVDALLSEGADLAALDEESDALTGHTQTSGVIDKFNEAFGQPPWMLEFLDSNGYESKGHGAVFNGVPTYRFLAPQSRSGSPGVLLGLTKKGRWRVKSFHSDDPLGGKANDAFGIYCVLAHNSDLAAALQGASDLLPKEFGPFLDRYAYLSTGTGYAIDLLFPPSHEPLTLTAFKNRTASKYRTEFGANGRPKLVPAWRDWLQHADRKTVDALGYWPGKERIYQVDGVSYGNTFHLPDFPQTQSEDRINWFLQHIQYLVADDEQANLLIDWLAARVQRPGERPLFTPLHIAQQHGTGRGLVLQVMKHLLGAWNCGSVDVHELVSSSGGRSQYDDYMYRNLLVSAEETSQRGLKRFEVTERLRDLLTQQHRQFNIKYGKNLFEPVWAGFFLQTNSPDGIALTEEDRRIWVLECPHAHKDDAYYRERYALAEDTEFQRQLFWLFKRRDLTHYLGITRAPKTDARAKVVSQGMNDLEAAIDDWLLNPAGPIMTMGQILQDLKNRYGVADYELGMPGDKQRVEGQIAAVLKKRGLAKLQEPRQVTWCGKKHRPWVIMEPTGDVAKALDKAQKRIDTHVSSNPRLTL